MVTLKVKVVFDEEILGTASANPDIHAEYIASKAPDAKSREEEVAAIGAEEVFEKGMTVFPRNEQTNEPIVFDYQWKGYFKDSFGFLRKIPGTECSKIKAFKKEIDGLVFPQPRRIVVHLPEGKKLGLCQRPLRGQTAQGERIALATSECAPAGSWMEFEIKLLLDGHEKAVIEALNYGQLHGFGQWRNSGKGIFHYEILEREKSNPFT